FVKSLFLIENLPGSTVIVGKLHLVFWIALTAGIAFRLLTPRIKDHAARAAWIVVFAAAVFCAQDVARHLDRPFKMTALDVGQGDAIYFEFPKGGNLLIDSGKGGDSDQGRWVVAPFLKSKGVRVIDTLVISHPQEDHIGGMSTILDEFNVRRILEPDRPYDSKLYGRLKRKMKEERAQLVPADADGRLEGYKDVDVLILNPDHEAKPHKDINDESVVLRITYGRTSFLLTGDIEEAAARDILSREKSLEADVLKVPHHGAKLGAEGELFVKAVSPKVSVISVGERNPYHHPSPKTLAALGAIPGNLIYRTDLSGAIEIVSDGSSVKVSSK
ncbi:MAG: ComEC/Rec2 family competence protein, partial [Candidatus Omnitrophota bacterium]